MRLYPLQENGGSEAGSGPREPTPSWQAWLETVGMVGALVAIGALIDRRDPFLLRRGFSWLTLAPLLSGLQYGSTFGLSGAGLQAIALAIAWKSGLTEVPDSLAEIVLGWLLAGLLAGEFHDAWLRRICRLESFRDHLRERLEGLGRAYLALKISHDRIQRTAPAATTTLRDALADFRRELMDRSEPASLDSIGDRILELFAEHAFVRAATLHAVDRRGEPGPAVASLGKAEGGEADPLVRKAALTGITMSLRDAADGEAILAAVPLIDLSCRTRAIVAIREMPFLALNAETLELLAVLGGRLGDCLSRKARPRSRRVIELLGHEPSALSSSEVAAIPARVRQAK